MDSDDDYDMESGDYDLYSDGGGTDHYNNGDDDHQDESEYGFVEEAMDDSVTRSSQINYIVLKEEDIRNQQKDDIQQLSIVFSITEVEASLLLLHYHWNLSKVNDEWFADEERVRKTVGILDAGGSVCTRKPRGRKVRKVICGICFDSFRRKDIVPVVCGHSFCSTCWNGYISTAINDGPGCLMLKCPQPSCPVAVGRDIIEKLVSEEDKDKYERYFLRSYIEESRKMKWCPAPGCEHAIEFSSTGTSSSYDVSCLCSYSFCWNCTEDAHRPVDCDTVAKWIIKNSSEAENTKWILANSKACPKCKRPIQKNHGCMHMTCTPPCRHEFCWLCLGAWADHGERTGGHYACNRYEKDKKEGLYDEGHEAERQREMAKNSLRRYTHYYERWESNQKSRQKATEDLKMFLSEKVTKLSDIQCIPETQLSFITDAWLQIIECRRVLQWTYAYGYYLLESDREFFEYIQGEADSGLERLHKCVEMELNVFQNAEEPSDSEQDFKFNNFRIKLTTLTSVTKTHFETLAKALENGRSDVDSQATSS